MSKRIKRHIEPKVKLSDVKAWLDTHIKEYTKLREKAVNLKDYLRVEGGLHALEDFKENLDLAKED